MNINNVKGAMGYSRTSVMNDLNSQKISSKQSLGYTDKIDISKTARNISVFKGRGICIDKGTAANTTLYVDRGTFNQISTLATFPECKWEEMGVDGEKRWIVINGQRFECPLSKEEKELRRKLAERCNLISILTSNEKEKKLHNKENQGHNSVKLNFDNNNKVKAEGFENCVMDEKIKNLMNNEKVMEILSQVVNANGGKGITLVL